tara:strand:- start:2689 stop:3048 length:360 start_codon:yes stop_codon:yes gene_type:complete
MNQIDKLVSLLPEREEEAKTADQLTREMGYRRSRTGEDIRELIRVAIAHHKKPIVSSRRGYWLASSVEDIERYIDSLDKRIFGLKNRKSNIIQAWLESHKTIPFFHRVDNALHDRRSRE